MALEQVAAARGVRCAVLASRPRRALRESVRPFAGWSFAERRREAVTAEWLSSQPGEAGRQDFLITWQRVQGEPSATVERRSAKEGWQG